MGGLALQGLCRPELTLDAPLSAETYKVVAGRPTAGEISCEDAELDALAFNVVQPPSHGTLSPLIGTGDSRSFIYTAASSHRGPDLFSLEANDGSMGSEPVSIALLVEAPEETSPTGGRPDQGTPPSALAVGDRPAPASKTVSCAEQQGQARTRCLLDQRVARSCGKLGGKRKAACAKRIRALARCDETRAKDKQGQARKEACKKQAQAIGKPRRRSAS